VTDDHGEEQDPLLVRPYLRHDDDAPAADRSTQTWPAATTREVRSQHALQGADDPTAIIPVVPPERTRRRGSRRLLVLLAACAAVLVGVTAAGFAAMRAARPAITAAHPDAPVPALTGLVPGSPTASPTGPAPTPTHKPSSHRPPTASATTKAAKPSTSAPAGTVSGTTKSPSAARAPKLPSTRTGTIRGQDGRCLDLSGGAAVPFNPIQVADCTGTAAQTWTLGTDGTLRVQGMCALIVGDDTVHIIACDTRTTAQWRIDGQQLINAADDECLTEPSTGTAVKVTTCDGSAGQRWSLP